MRPAQIIVLILGIALLAYVATHKIGNMDTSPDTLGDSSNTSSVISSSGPSGIPPTTSSGTSNSNKSLVYLSTYQTIRFDSGEGLKANEYAMASKRRNGAQLYYICITDEEKIEAFNKGKNLIGDIRTTADPEEIAGKILRKAAGEIYYRESIQDGRIVRQEISKQEFDTRR